MTDTQDHERRASFRIDTSALIKWALPIPDQSSAETYFQELQNFALQSEVNALSSQIDQLNERIKDIAALKAITLLHQQIKILMKADTTQQVSLSGLNIEPVNVSEGGCSFLSPAPFSADEKIVLALVFPPSYFSLFTFVRVRSCQSENEQFRVHLEFSDLTEKQRQELVRFMFQAQTLHKKAGNLN